MNRCTKCGKILGEYFITAYGEARCADCYDDYLMTDKGKVEYLISIVGGGCPLSDYDSDFLGWVATCWKKYRNELALPFKDVIRIEAVARVIGLL